MVHQMVLKIWKVIEKHLGIEKLGCQIFSHPIWQPKVTKCFWSFRLVTEGNQK
jgi:hypothetical protein